jgi:uncharacterized protein (TIGR00369 family)
MPSAGIKIPPNCEVTLGMTCVDKSNPGSTTWRMIARDDFANPIGVVQGGFLTAMADSAMGSATITYARASGRKVFSSSIEIKTSFLAPARVGATLYCSAKVVHGGRRIAFTEAQITDEAGTVITRSTGSYVYTPAQSSGSE